MKGISGLKYYRTTLNIYLSVYITYTCSAANYIWVAQRLSYNDVQGDKAITMILYLTDKNVTGINNIFIGCWLL